MCSGIWSVATTRIGCWTWIWPMGHCELWKEVLNLSKNTGAIDVNMNGSVLEEKLCLKILGFTFSSKLDSGSYIISIAKNASKKIGALIHFMKFLSPEAALYVHKSTTRPFMKYCCHAWAGAPSCYLELLVELQKRICRSFTCSLLGPSFTWFHLFWREVYSLFW